MHKVNIKDKIGKVSGIYKLTFPNGKIYIGQSVDIKRRIKEHNSSLRGAIIPHVIAKYGQIDNFEILEEIPADQPELMNEREEYYINFFNSLTTGNGYNILMNSESKRDINLPWVQEVVCLLTDNNFTEEEIANFVDKDLSTISNINTGKTYFNSKLSYPIRKKRVYHSYILSQQQISEIIELLKTNTKMTMKEIAATYNISEITVQRINKGSAPYFNKNLVYPIRKKNWAFCKFSQQEIKEIINLLKNSNKTQIEIAKMYNCDRKIIGEINSGKKYFQENESYPIRG